MLWHMYRRTFNFQTIVHQKLLKFSVLVIRTQRQFHVFYLRVGGIDPDGEKLQFACYFCAAFDEIFLLCSSPGGIIRASRRQCYPCFKCSADFGFSDSVRQSRQIRFLCLSCCVSFHFLCPDAKRPQLPNGNYGLMSPLFHSMSCARNRGHTCPQVFTSALK